MVLVDPILKNVAMVLGSTLFCLCSFVQPGLTENTGSDRVIVHVRLVEASQGDRGIVDPRLQDLMPKFQALHFKSFKLLGSNSRVVTLDKKGTLTLPDGNTLTFRPMHAEANRIGMWIKWRDGAGMEVLDTRMHFDTGQTMITGTDTNDDSGTILAIDVEPVE